MSRQIISSSPKVAKPSVTKIFKVAQNSTRAVAIPARKQQGMQWVHYEVNRTSYQVRFREEWADEEYRHAYMEAAVEQGVAWQIKINREARGISQSALAMLLGTKQSAVSRLEDPEYGAHSLDTLKKVANIFDCALLVRLVPYSVLARESECLSREDLFAESFDEENEKLARDSHLVRRVNYEAR